MAFKTPVYYNNFNLSDIDGVSIYNHNFIETPSRVLNSSKLARADKSVLTSAEFSNKTIAVYGIVCKATKSLTEAAFETLKGIVSIPEGTIRVEQGGLNVNYIGTLQGVSHEYFGHNLKFTLTFLCSNPIGANLLTSTLLSVASNTDANHTFPITIEGSFKATPSIHLVYTSVTGGTTGTLRILNANTFQGISLSRNFITGDIIDINSRLETVTVNSVDTDYGGNFPNFYPGVRAFQYVDDFTNRDVAIEVTYNKQFA